MIMVNIENASIRAYQFLQEMFEDSYFPKPLVEKGKAIMLRLCEDIEREKPDTDAAIYALTHAATERFNDLEQEFVDAGSEIETAARENIAHDIAFILQTYGFELDIEEAIAPREW